MKYSQAVLLILLVVLPYTTTAEEEESIIILAGQSNMVGEGGVNANHIWDRVVPIESQPNPRILRLNSNLQWETAVEPLHAGISAPCGVGPGLPFASSALKPNERFYLVPCAQGGTSITEWQRGSRLYDRLIHRTQAAVSSGGGQIRAMLWYQGESDINNMSSAKAYKVRLVQFFNDLRADLNSPLLPIIQVALAKTGTDIRHIVREAQLNTGLPNVYCVDAYSLNVTLQNDGLNIHLDTPSQVKLGQALATVFLNITSL